MKTCFKCGRALPLEEFYRHPMMADGHLGKCKDCTRTDVGLNRVLRSDHYRNYDKARSLRPDRVEARQKRNASTAGFVDRSIASQKHKLERPQQYRANYAVTNAIRDGRLVRGSCEVCGSAKVHAHHDDYGKPLVVRWLCRRHHREHHLSLR